MWLVEERDFPLVHDLKLVALQGDCALREEVSAEGSRYAVDAADRAKQACLGLVDHARAASAHLALIPEMVIPLAAVPDLLARIESNPQPLVLIGGVEGISPAQYRALVVQHGGTPDVQDGAAGTYVNAMLVAIRTATHLNVYFRAKRFASGTRKRNAHR